VTALAIALNPLAVVDLSRLDVDQLAQLVLEAQQRSPASLTRTPCIARLQKIDRDLDVLLVRLIET